MTARRTKSRFASRPLNGQSASLPAHDHPAIMSGRTIFPGTVGRSLARFGARNAKGELAAVAVFGTPSKMPDDIIVLEREGSEFEER